ncbi:MAG: hypothetical protein Q9168_006525, partial [Polycauliona sp. 1 TL-2023]
MASESSLRKRLLRDIAEIQSEPYPCIRFHVHDSLEEACLILTPEDSKPLHLKMTLKDYPLQAPTVTIQSRVRHPNVFGSYICASILNTQEGYTPAYTLKSIAIQLLSFFISDSIEQVYGYNLRLNRQKDSRYASPHNYRAPSDREAQALQCGECGFDARPVPFSRNAIVRAQKRAWEPESRRVSVQQNRVIRGHRFVTADESRRSNDTATGATEMSPADLPTALSDTSTPTESSKMLDSEASMVTDQPMESLSTSFSISAITDPTTFLMDLPHEILINIFSNLPFQALTALSSASSKASEIIHFYDLIRLCELQCFCLKEHFQNSRLGVGVAIGHYGKEKTLSSEFDLLSDRAFYQHYIRRSIHGIEFEIWLPLSISRRHFASVKSQIFLSLDTMASAAGFADTSPFSVLSHFLNDIVVAFSEEANRVAADRRSTLTHASEKAVESYFAIYHLLLCLAADNPNMVQAANSKVARFLSGKTSKLTCPNLGHLMVATLISEQTLSETLSVAIIKEAVLRNVVWMLDAKGAGMLELSYMEPEPVSEYRLQKTFEASLTSYRLLMFCHLFCRTARGTNNLKSLAELRDQLFDTHGAPPRGVAASMAQDIRNIKSMNAFPAFLKEMGIQERNLPTK